MLRSILIAAACAAAGAALADSEARRGSDFVRITVRPCADEKVVAAITAAGEDPKDYRAARAEIGGAPFAGCWKPMFEREMIFLRYDDGDAGLLPFGELKPVKEV